MHFCGVLPCRARLFGLGTPIHVEQFRVLTLAECSKLPYAAAALKLYEESTDAAGAASKDTASDDETDAAAIAGLAPSAHPAEGARPALQGAGKDRVPGMGGFHHGAGEVRGLNHGVLDPNPAA